MQIDANKPERMSVTSCHVALLIASNDSVLASPMLRKKSFGGNAGGTYPKFRLTPSTPTTSSDPASAPSMMSSWDSLIFLPTNFSGCGTRAMIFPSRSAINFEDDDEILVPGGDRRATPSPYRQI